ncbi:hypothetical protein [Tenacibaculum sp. M341]|uniref:hypothetical protein n=1 Tax=Tenacibaculum sp. M341 TaxID=2530339 RepID=UPI001044B6C0|nr:hypothetical protein [Tenacibaculum sp. M341]TCI85528.1 hypothetical protein EYW44_16330 [Tenacibaculum sp. M341]
MLKNILNLGNVVEMSKNQQKTITGGLLHKLGSNPDPDLITNCADDPAHHCCVEPQACEHE